MKKIFTIILFFIVLNSSFAQHTFQYIKYFDNIESRPVNVIEDSLGNIIVLYDKGSLFGARNSHLLILSPEGVVLKDIDLNIKTFNDFSQLQKVDNEICLLINNYSNINTCFFSIYRLTDNYELELVNEWNLNNKAVFKPRFLDSQNWDYLIATATFDEGEYFCFNNLLFLELNSNWDTLKSVSYPNISLFDIQYIRERQIYFLSGLENNVSKFITFDSALNKKEIYSNNDMPIFRSAIRVINDKILAIGDSMYGNYIELCQSDSLGKIISGQKLGNIEVKTQMALNNPMVNSSNGTFYGFSNEWEHGVSVYSPAGHKLHLVKFDSSVNVVFEKFYGSENASYYANDFCASADGGCIMAAQIYDTTISKDYCGIQILKVDSLGNYTPTSIKNESKQEQNIAVYPNPGSDQINLRIPENLESAEFNLYSVSGKKVLNQYIENKQATVFTSHLQKGIYIFELRKNGEVLNRGKWVKQ